MITQFAIKKGDFCIAMFCFFYCMCARIQAVMTLLGFLQTGAKSHCIKVMLQNNNLSFFFETKTVYEIKCIEMTRPG